MKQVKQSGGRQEQPGSKGHINQNCTQTTKQNTQIRILTNCFVLTEVKSSQSWRNLSGKMNDKWFTCNNISSVAHRQPCKSSLLMFNHEGPDPTPIWNTRVQKFISHYSSVRGVKKVLCFAPTSALWTWGDKKKMVANQWTSDYKMNTVSLPGENGTSYFEALLRMDQSMVTLMLQDVSQ